MEWETVVGLETHAQLSTRSKIFSGAATRFGAAPNTQACAVDVALPGVLPVLNKGAVERAIRFGLAIGAEVRRRSVFARKNYFYPDLPKGYQISQFEAPIVQGGAIQVLLPDGTEKTVRLTRAHLEEDAGKSLHEDFHGMSGIDLNRAGTPLLEIVTEPDMRLYDPDRDETRSMRSKEEAHDYRYFPEPDLLPLELSEAWIEEIRAKLPELPAAKRERYTQELGLSPY